MDSKSVALRYDRSCPAPFVAAKGRGHLAEKLAVLAREYDVPTVQAEDLADSLFYLEVGEFIPEPFYRVVAELLAYVWRQEEDSGRWYGKDHGSKEDQNQ